MGDPYAAVSSTHYELMRRGTGQDVAINLAASTVARAAPLLALIVIARLMDKEEFGLLGIVRSIVFGFEALAVAGMGLTATKFVALYKTDNDPRVFQVVITTALIAFCFGACCAVLVWFFASSLASGIERSSDVQFYLYIAALTLPMNAVSTALTGALIGLERFRTRLAISLVSGVSALVVLLVLAEAYGVHGVVTGFVINAAILLVLSGAAMFRDMGSFRTLQVFRIEKALATKVLQFGLPAALAGIAVGPATAFAVSYVARQEDGVEAVATYTAIYQVFAVLLFLATVTSQTILPKLTRKLLMDGMTRYRHSFVRLGVYLAVPLLAAALLVLIFADSLLTVFGPNYQNDVTILRLLTLAAVLESFDPMIKTAIAVSGDIWWSVAANVAWATTYVLFVVASIHMLSAVHLLPCALLSAAIIRLSVNVFALRRATA